MAVRADPSVAVAALLPDERTPTPLRPYAPSSTVAELAAALAVAPDQPLVVVVDDAELVDDPDGVLARLLTGDANVIAGPHGCHPVRLRALDAGARRRRRGLLLAPESDVDGDLFGITLPRWPLAPAATGRGYLVRTGRARWSCSPGISSGISSLGRRRVACRRCEP